MLHLACSRLIKDGGEVRDNKFFLRCIHKDLNARIGMVITPSQSVVWPVAQLLVFRKARPRAGLSMRLEFVSNVRHQLKMTSSMSSMI